jgi:anti-sigma factor RsiW
MNCDDVRPELLHYQRGQLSTPHRNDIRAHLQGCPACAHEATADALLTETLERRLPQHAAPLGLKRRLAAQWPRTSPHQPSWWVRWRLSVVPALATAAVLLIAVPIYYGQFGRFQSDRSASMVAEAVTNHLRLLSSQHPLDIGCDPFPSWHHTRRASNNASSLESSHVSDLGGASLSMRMGTLSRRSRQCARPRPPSSRGRPH